MPELHTLLVNTKSYTSSPIERDELIEEIRAFAANITSRFSGIAFIYRETDNAGRWSEDYPENVMLGKEHPKQVVKELRSCLENQESALQNYITRLGHFADHSVRDLTEFIWKKRQTNDYSYTLGYTAYNLKMIGKLLQGSYNFESGFYDTQMRTTLITGETLKKVEEHPENWALVFFDLHV